MPCSAQYEKYYQVNNSTYVTTTPNAELYELSSSDVDQYVNNSYSTKSREIIDTSNCKKKKIKNYFYNYTEKTILFALFF